MDCKKEGAYRFKIALKTLGYLALIIGCFYGTAIFLWGVSVQFPPPVELNFTKYGVLGEEPVEMGPILIEKTGQRLHQFEDERIGCIVRYRFTNLDSAEPLAGHYPIDWEKHGLGKPEGWGITASLKLRVISVSPKWKFIRAEKATISNPSYHWDENTTVNNDPDDIVQVNVEPAWNGNTPDLHVIEIDFYMSPKNESMAK